MHPGKSCSICHQKLQPAWESLLPEGDAPPAALCQRDLHATLAAPSDAVAGGHRGTTARDSFGGESRDGGQVRSQMADEEKHIIYPFYITWTCIHIQAWSDLSGRVLKGRKWKEGRMKWLRQKNKHLQLDIRSWDLQYMLNPVHRHLQQSPGRSIITSLKRAFNGDSNLQ